VETTAARRQPVAASFTSAVGKTMAGSLPPSSRNDGMRRWAHCAATCLPTAVEPVNTRPSTVEQRASDKLAPGPRTYLKTPASSGIRSTVSKSGLHQRGVTDEGFKTTAHPATSAGIVSNILRMIG